MKAPAPPPGQASVIARLAHAKVAVSADATRQALIPPDRGVASADGVAAQVRAVLQAFDADLLSATKAATILGFVDQAEPVSDPEALAQAMDAIVAGASDRLGALDPEATPHDLRESQSDEHAEPLLGRFPGFTDRELRVLTARTLRMIRPVADLEAHEVRATHGRSLHTLPHRSGMSEYRLIVEPEAAAVIDAAASAFSAPEPAEDGAPDPRSAARRRADALLATIQRGVSGPPATPKSEKAQVLVTIPLEDLRDQVRGAGVTMNGHVLSPETVRRLACDAGVLPVVLGTRKEILDLGRTSRLFSPAQRKAMWLRDQGCTYPGCTIPAQWCDAHHVIPWVEGGLTDLSNGALLCARHHTRVHTHRITAAVDGHGVTWHT